MTSTARQTDASCAYSPSRCSSPADAASSDRGGPGRANAVRSAASTATSRSSAETGYHVSATSAS